MPLPPSPLAARTKLPPEIRKSLAQKVGRVPTCDQAPAVRSKMPLTFTLSVAVMPVPALSVRPPVLTAACSAMLPVAVRLTLLLWVSAPLTTMSPAAAALLLLMVSELPVTLSRSALLSTSVLPGSPAAPMSMALVEPRLTEGALSVPPARVILPAYRLMPELDVTLPSLVMR